MPEVTNVTVTEQTLFNLTITEDGGTTVAVTVGGPVAQVFTSLAEIDATMQNNGTGLGVYKQKDYDAFLMRSITDDDKTIDTSLQNNDDEIRIKLPDAGISTPDGFTINADSDSTAKIELPGATVDLSKAKLLTELDANGQEINDILNATATDSFIGDLRGAVKFRAKAGEDLSKGEAVYISGISGNTPIVSLAKADSATTMPAYGLAFADANENANVEIIEFGDLKGLDTATDSLELDKPVYVSATTAGVVTATRPTGATHLVQNIGLVNRIHASAGAIKVGGSGRVNDVPNQFSIEGDITTTAGTITAPTGAITTVNATTVNTSDLNVTDDLVVTDDLTVSGDVQFAQTLGVFGLATFSDDINQTIGNTATLPVLNTTTFSASSSTLATVDINGGTIDGTTIGATGSSTGRFTTLASDSVDINGGAIDGTPIGANTSAAGTFTTLGATTVNATDGNITNDLDVTNNTTTGSLNVTGNTVLSGDLTVSGTTTTVNTETINLADNNILLNSNHTGAPTQDGGITIERGTSDDTVFQWNETNDVFEFKEGSNYAHIKANQAEFTDTVSIGGVTPEVTGYVDLAVADSVTVGGDFTVSGTAAFEVLGFTNRVKIDCNTLNSTSGDGLVLWDSTRTDNDLTNSNSAEALHKNGGTAPYNTSGDSPVTYITNESIEMHLDAVRAGNHGTAILKPDFLKLVKDGAGTDTITTIRSDSASFSNTISVTGLTTTSHLSVTGEVQSDLIPDIDDTHDLGSPSNKWRDLYLGPGSLYIDGHKVLGSDATGQIDITTDDDQSLNITAGAAGTTGDITISSAGNTTSIDDTTIHLGPQNNSGTVYAHGTLEAPDLHVADLEFAGNKIDSTATNGNLEIATNGTGYLHANVADLYIGPISGATKIDENSITVSNTDGDLNLAGNGAGLVNINSQSLITDSAGGLTAPILELETDNSGWNRPQLMLKDSNADAVSIVGEHNTTYDYYQLNYTLDPNNDNGDTSTTNFAGDYYLAFAKDYSTPSSVKMKMDVYGANDGFNITARSDFGAFPTRYSARPIRFNGQKIEFYSSDNTTPFGNFTERLIIEEDRSKFSNVVKLNNASSDPSGENGDMYYNTTTNKFRGYQNGAWINLDGS